MDVRLVGQPYADYTNLTDFLKKVAGDKTLTNLRISVAWAKGSGLSRVETNLRQVAARGNVQMIVGISEGGATKQGLELAMELATECYVFYDPTGRTFHPKLYHATGADHALTLIGSNNLTAGGVYFNYEVAVECHSTLDNKEDMKFVSEVDGLLSRMLDDEGLCKRLDSQLLGRLIADPRYRIQSRETSGRSSETSKRGADGEGPDPIFGPSKFPRRRMNEGAVSSPVLSSAEFAEQMTGPPSYIARRRWWKKLRGSDAQQPPRPGSNVTGNLRLSQAEHPINHRTYFREEFFGELNWTKDPKKSGLDFAELYMDVFIDGEPVGPVRFRIDHNVSRIADQGNVPTVLKWGAQVGALLRGKSHVGEFVVIEATDEGSFRLSIQPDVPIEFLY